MTGARCLEQDHPDFPAALLLAAQPPARVWVQGRLELLQQPAVGIIGTRRPTAYGLGVTLDIARDLAAQGLVVVSGMAPGLDARAHQGALEAGGGTIAVLGCGIDVDYPRPNLELLDQVRERGLVITEFEPGLRPLAFTFPRRNRLIAALSRALVVVEARIASGTANTVEWMNGLGRPVFAVPGRLGDPMSEGPNLLLQEGARVYLHPNDVLGDLGLPLIPDHDRPPRRRGSAPAPRPDLFGAEAEVFDKLGRRPQHVDLLARSCALEPALLLAALSSLELKGLVVQLPGKHFALAA